MAAESSLAVIQMAGIGRPEDDRLLDRANPPRREMLEGAAPTLRELASSLPRNG